MKKLWQSFTLALVLSVLIFGGGSENPHIVIKTELGDITVEIYEKAAPITASIF
ncbi:MAG: peptidylprolyl isomerase [Candidatus Aminicenantes bacterium]|nr:peptidylprolyl isomerase [Candidatus Aminicenantes bacterium]